MKYEQYEKAMKQMIGKLPKNKVSKAMSKSEDENAEARCSLAHQVFREALGMYKNGTLTWDEMMSDVTDNLATIKDMDVPKVEEDKEDEETS